MSEERWRLPDGRIAIVPDGWSDRQKDELRYRIATQYTEDQVSQDWLRSQRTMIGDVDITPFTEPLFEIPRSMLRTGVMGLQGVAGLLTPGTDTVVEKGLRWGQELLSPNVTEADNPVVKYAGALGSTIPYLVAGVVSQGATLPMGFGAITGIARQSEAVNRERQGGADVGIGTEMMANLGGAAVGLTEGLPIGGILGRMPGVRATREAAVRGLVTRAMGEGARDSAALLAKIPARAWAAASREGLLAEAARSFMGEGTQEATASVLQGFIEKGLYNDDLVVTESLLEEFLLGGLAGGTVSVATNVLMNSPDSRQKAYEVQQRAREAQIRSFEAATYMGDVGTQLVRSLGSVEVPGAVDVEVPVGTGGYAEGKTILQMAEEGAIDDIITKSYAIVEIPDIRTGTGGSMMVIADRKTGKEVKGIPILKTADDANRVLNALQAEQVALAGLVNNTASLYQDGLETNPAAQSLLRITRGIDPTAQIPRSSFPTLLGTEAEGADNSPKAFWARFAAEHPDLADAASLSIPDFLKIADESQAERFFGSKARLGRENLEQTISNRVMDVLDFSSMDAEVESNPDLPGRGVLPEKYINEDGSPTGFKREKSDLQSAAKRALARVGIEGSLSDSGVGKMRKIKDPGIRELARQLTGVESFYAEPKNGGMTTAQKVFFINAIESMPSSPVKINVPLANEFLSPKNIKGVQRALKDKTGAIKVSDVRTAAKLDPDVDIRPLLKAVERRTGDAIHIADGKITVTKKTRPLFKENPAYDPSNNRSAISEAYSEMESHDFRSFLAELFYKNEIRELEANKEKAPITEDIDERARKKSHLMSERAESWIKVGKEYNDMMFKERNSMNLQGIAIGAPSNSRADISKNSFGSNSSIKQSFDEWANAVVGTLMMKPGSTKADAPLGYYDSLGNRISININAVDPNMEMSEDQLFKATAGLRGHEYFHALVENNYLYDNEIEDLVKAASKTVVPKEVDADAHGKGRTFLDVAKSRIKPDAGYNDTRIEMEAVADMWAAVALGHISESGITTQQRNANKVITNLLKRSIGILKDSDIRKVGALVEAWRSGEIGNRGAGASMSRIRGGRSVDGEEGGQYFAPGEFRAPKTLAKIYLSAEELQTVKGLVDKRAAQLTRAFNEAVNPDGPPVVGVEAETPAFVDKDQLSFFERLAGNGKLDFLDKLGVPHAVEYEVVSDRDGAPIEAIVLHLPGEKSAEALEGIAKVVGDGLVADNARLRTVVGFGEGNTTENSFGVTLKLPVGTDPDQLMDALEALAGEQYQLYPEMVGGELVLMDPMSSSIAYSDGDALAFAQSVKDAMFAIGSRISVDYMPNGNRIITTPVGNAEVVRTQTNSSRRPRWIVQHTGRSTTLPIPEGEFNSDQEAVDAVVDSLRALSAASGAGTGIELNGVFIDERNFDRSSFEGGLNQMEAGLEQGKLERDARKAGIEGADGPQGPLNLRSLAINSLHETSGRIRESLTGEAAVRGYELEGSAVDGVSEVEKVAAGIVATEEELNGGTMPPLFGNATPDNIVTAARALRDGYDPDLAGYGTPKSFSKNHYFEAPEGFERLQRTVYLKDLDPKKPMWESAIEILDAPNLGVEIRAKLRPFIRSAVYQIADRVIAAEELSKRVNEYRRSKGLEPFTAVTSTIASIRTGLERSSALAMGAINGAAGGFAVYDGDNPYEGGFGATVNTIFDGEENHAGVINLFSLLHSPDRVIDIHAHEIGLKLMENDHLRQYDTLLPLVTRHKNAVMFISGLRADIALAKKGSAADMAGIPILEAKIEKAKEDLMKPSDLEFANDHIEAVKAQGSGLGEESQRKDRLKVNKDYIAKIREGLTKEENAKMDRFLAGYKNYQNQMLESSVNTGLLGRNSLAYEYMKDSYYIPLVEDYREKLGASEDLDALDEMMKRMREIRHAKPSMDSAATVLERKRTTFDTTVDTPLFMSTVIYTLSAYRNMASNVAKARTVRDLSLLGELITENSADPDFLRATQNLSRINVRDNGEQSKYVIQDMKLANALLGLHNSTWSNSFGRGLRRMSRMARDLITATPDFILRQITRDPTSTEIVSGASGGIWKAHKNYFATLYESLGDANDTEMMRAVIGGWALPVDYNVTTTDAVDLETQIRKMADLDPESKSGRAWANVKKYSAYDWLSGMSRKTEFASRKAVYDKVLAETGDIHEANFQALEVINFGRRGSNNALHFVASISPFLNAGIQGASVFVRAATGSYSSSEMDVRRARRAFMARGIMMTAFTSLYWMANRLMDDDEYDEMTDRERESYYSFPLPGGVRMRIPISFEAGVMFKVVPEAMLNAAFADREKSEFFGALVRGGGIFAQRDQIGIPWVFRPLAEAFVTNKTAFSGAPVVPGYVSANRLPSDQYNANTSRSAVAATRGLNALLPRDAELSPLQVEHVVEGYLPGLMMYVFGAADAMTRTAMGVTQAGASLDTGEPLTYPAIRAFFKKAGGGNEEDFYQVLERTRQIHGSVTMAKRNQDLEALDDLVTNPDHSKYLNVRTAVEGINQQLANLRRERDLVLRSLTYTAAQKRDIFREQEERREEILRRVPQIREYLRNGG